MRIICLNGLIFLVFGYDRHFILTLFKLQSYSKLRKIKAFYRKICICHNPITRTPQPLTLRLGTFDPPDALLQVLPLSFPEEILWVSQGRFGRAKEGSSPHRSEKFFLDLLVVARDVPAERERGS